MMLASHFVIYRESRENKMKFQFEVPDEVAEAHAFLSKRTAFFGMSPRLLTIQLYMRALDAEKQLVAASAPKPAPPQKVDAKQRMLDERKAAQAVYREEKLAGYRVSGVWPRVVMLSKYEPLVNPDNGRLRFTDPDDHNRQIEGWEPPEDYPHMGEYAKALAYAEKSGVTTDPNAPKQKDFVDDDGYPDFDAFQSAETKYRQAQFRGEIPY